MAEKFDHLEEHLEKFVENIRQLGIIVSDFQPSSQAGLNQKLNFIVTGLQDIDKCRQQLHDITVPLEVFEYIDQGRNPQLYTKECLERALARNEQVKGKIDTMKGALRRLTDTNSVLPSPGPRGELEERSSRLTEKELEEAFQTSDSSSSQRAAVCLKFETSRRPSSADPGWTQSREGRHEEDSPTCRHDMPRFERPPENKPPESRAKAKRQGSFIAGSNPVLCSLVAGDAKRPRARILQLLL
uniref:Mediator of RNA polymerase II transcription subunit 10 n=1 Tax=Felis catus TaxID=9685 RepID=A0ABI7Y8E5_FELCA